jgi:UDP-glucuronate 4-epimerase
MTRYLVTGAAGFIGSQLCESLLADGHRVVGVDSFTDYYPRALKRANLAIAEQSPDFELQELDLAADSLRDLVVGAEGIFHLAAQPGVRKSWGDAFAVYLRDNILATQRVFEAAVDSGARVVYASSSSVYGDSMSYPTPEVTQTRPVSPYGITKLACESLAHAFASGGLDAIGLRYFTVYGPRQRPDMAFTRIGRALLAGQPFTVLGSGHQSRDVTFVDDAVSATRAAMTKGLAGAIYNVGGGSETSLLEAIGLFEDLAGSRLECRFEDVARGDVKRTVSDCTALTSDTGWHASVPIRQGIERQLDWCRRSVPDEHSA